ncbi:MAG: hypothetical protein KUG82_00745 [Pseudomonadales bacterium]|nr:hypothetical protein [Pseudomonadales bacterium]
MHKFLETCSELGIDKSDQRHKLVCASLNALTYDAILFLICGYEYIHRPSSKKWEGISSLFLAEDGDYAINIYPECREHMQRILGPGNLSLKMKSAYGHTDSFDGQSAGVGQKSGAGDYNLITKALETTLTHHQGLAQQSTLIEIKAKTKLALQNPKGLSKVGQMTLGEMSQALAPYWGGDLNQLGLMEGLKAAHAPKSRWKFWK